MSTIHQVPEISISGFEILELLGEGGMAKVYKARQTRLDRIVAVKVLKFGIAAEDEEERERFKSEARAAATINHPNIVQIIDAGEVGTIPYYVMEYVPGYSVADLLDIKRIIPEEDALSIASELANALEYCWDQHQMIHCDIKPDNIMLHTEGTVKLADLGLARVLGRAQVEIENDMTMGTPHYMSPEQALADDELDCRSDMYSLGAMLYHMLTGVIPFHSLDMEVVLQKQIEGFLPDPYEVNPNLSGASIYLIEKMMAKHSSDRQQSWGEVAADIELVIAGHMINKPIRGESISTISRHPERPMPKIVPPKKKQARMHVKADQKPKRRILISEKEKKQIAAHHQHREHDEMPRSLSVLGLIAVLFILLYGYTALVTNKRSLDVQALLPVQAAPPSTRSAPAPIAGRIQAGSAKDRANRDAVLDEVTKKLNRRKAPRSAPEKTGVKAPPAREDTASANAAIKPPPLREDIAPAPPALTPPKPGKDPGPKNREGWDNPDYARAVRGAINLRKIFIQHIKRKAPLEDLQKIESAARHLVDEFDKLEAIAPAGVSIEAYKRDMNRLIFDCHQSMRIN
ncbi:MAG: protein kinase [Verrucomicrobiota bacterium]